MTALRHPRRTIPLGAIRFCHPAALALLLISPFLTLSAPATAAGTGWCRSDPVVMIGGHVADIFVSAPLHAPLVVTGPTHIIVTVPLEVDTFLIASGPGFGHGEIVEFAESPSLDVTSDSIEVRIKVFVPATDETMPVLVELAPQILGLLAPATAEGTVNDWISLKAPI